MGASLSGPSQDPLAETIAEAFSAAEARDWDRVYTLFSNLPAGEPLPGIALELQAGGALKSRSLQEACALMESAFAAYSRAGDTRGAVKTASHLVGLYEAAGAEAACTAWEQRGLRLLETCGPCVEQGYMAIARTGCEIHDPKELAERAEKALELAVVFADRDLELRARAEKGLALVCLGFVNAGFALLDEVMASIAAGELRDDDMKGQIGR